MTDSRGPKIAILWCMAMALVGSNSSIGQAKDWPTHQGNAQRNAVTQERLTLPLSPVWVHQPRHLPQSAWPPPANQDFWHGESNLAPRVDFDRAFHVAVAGDSLLYGSSAEHAVHCLDVATGAVRWSFYTEGPVRFTPAVWQDKVYFGSDDGKLYCLTIRDGTPVWKYSPSTVDRRLPGNGHVISLWPVRTGAIIDDATVYAGAGLFPEHGVYLFALEAQTGKERWKRTISQPAQGYLAADAGALWVPSGRTGVTGFRLEDGKTLGATDSFGTYVVAAQGHVFCESSRYQRHLLIRGAVTNPAHFVTVAGTTAYFQGPRELVAVALAPYVQRGTELAALRSRYKELSESLKKNGRQDPDKAARMKDQLDALRKSIAEVEDKMNKCQLWRHKDEPAFSFLMAGDTLFCGRDGSVTAARSSDGEEVWKAPVVGRAYGLAVAHGCLFASTDSGRIYCFRSGPAAPLKTVKFPGPRSPDPSGESKADYASAVETILKHTPTRKGYALVLDCGKGRLANELARRSDFQIVGVEADAARAAKTRELLAQAGLLGRVTVHHVPGPQLPYPKYFANLIVSDGALTSGKLPSNWPEIRRVLRPYGGLAMFGGVRLAASAAEKTVRETAIDGLEVLSDHGAWLTLRRGPLAGAGEWTHQYADPANTTSSGDTLVRGKMDLLWFGEPGPRDMIDRHNRTMAPLVKDGRLFVPANERIIALDAYNGVRLWEVDVPGSRRLGVMKDSAHMAVANDLLYIVVAEKCWGLNVATGQREIVLQSPQPTAKESRQWGYVAVVEDHIFGTTGQPGASYRRHGNMGPVLEGDFRPVVMSDGLFSLDRKTGVTKWLYRAAILNSAIAVGNGRIYFLEVRDLNPAKESLDGRIRIDRFLGGSSFLVALDTKSGRKQWEVPLRLPFQHIIYLSYAPPVDAVLLTGTFNAKIGTATRVCYGLRAFRSETGAALWQRDLATGNPDGTHGEQWQHPVIVGREVLSKYYECDLRTGTPLPSRVFSPGGGCGTLSASASAVFLRGGNPRMFDLTESIGSAINRVSRPGCFINIIPAGGILSIPEASAGCTCPYPLQASFAYVPAEN